MISMLWFVSANYYPGKKLPFFFSVITLILTKSPCWKFPVDMVVVKPAPSVMKENENDNKQPSNNLAYKCGKCEECEFCLVKKEADNVKKKKKDKIDHEIKVLNDFFFLLAFLAFFITNLIIWAIIANN